MLEELKKKLKRQILIKSILAVLLIVGIVGCCIFRANQSQSSSPNGQLTVEEVYEKIHADYPNLEFSEELSVFAQKYAEAYANGETPLDGGTKLFEVPEFQEAFPENYENQRWFDSRNEDYSEMSYDIFWNKEKEKEYLLTSTTIGIGISENEIFVICF